MALYDRLRDMQMPLGVGRGNLPPSEPAPRAPAPQNVFVPPSVPSSTPATTPVFTPPQNQSFGIPTVLPAPVIPPQVIPAPAPVIPPQTINLGGGLGSVALPQIPAQVIMDAISQAIPQYNIPSTPFDEYLRDIEEQETAQEEQIDTGLEDKGVSEEVIQDVVVETPPPVGAIDSVTGEVIPEEDVILTTMPLPFPDSPLPIPTPAPAPAPAVDVVTGEEMPLITPVVDVPQDSMTGLGSYFTAPQIQQIVRPPQQIAGTTDMDKLLQLQRDSFLKFLVQPQQQVQAPAPTTTAPSSGGVSGFMGQGYTPFGGVSGSPYVNPVAEQVQNYMYSQPQTIQFPTNQMFGIPQPLLMARGPLDETRGSYGDVYGGLNFPEFSGITSLVPQEEINNLYRPQYKVTPY